MATLTTADLPPATPSGPSTKRLFGEQIGVTAGQLAAGLGNFAFSLLGVHLLRPAGFAQLATFLALYLLLHLPMTSLAAGAALDPYRTVRLRTVMAVAGSVGALALIALSGPVADLLGLTRALVIVLAFALPEAGLTALARGRLYGIGRRKWAIVTLVAEPVVRLILGGWLIVTVGSVGAAIAVVAAGYAALVIAVLAGRTPASWSPGADAAPPPSRSRRIDTSLTVGVFLLLAIMQTQDLVMANRLLEPLEAARFAAVSTIGATAVFASAQIPLVLLPRAKRGQRSATLVATAVAAALGAGAVLVVAVIPTAVIRTVLGPEYVGIRPLLVGYLAAMALLGAGRVVAAAGCATKRAAGVLITVAVATVVQAVVILTGPATAASVAHATLAATGVLTVGTLAVVTPQWTALRSRWSRRSRARALLQPIPLLVIGATVVGLVIRSIATRSIWLDEAISITEVKMSFGDMLHQLAIADVHPPLYFMLLWGVVHGTGSTAELVVRAPSIVIGTAMIPLMYTIGKDIFDRRAGAIAAVLTAIAPIAVWYSQEARMYSMFMLFALLAAWAQVRVLRTGSKKAWFAFTVVAALWMYTQYFAFIPLLVQFLAFFALAVRRGKVNGWKLVGTAVLAGVGVAILLLPLLPYLHTQLSAYASNGAGLTSVPGQAGQGASKSANGIGVYGLLANVIWAVWGYHADATMVAITALWPMLILGALAILGRGRTREESVLGATALLPMLMLFLIGFRKSNLFELRYFIGSVPLLILLMSRGITRLGRTALAPVIATCVLVSTMGVGLLDEQINSSNPRVYDFRGALREMESKARPGDQLIYAPDYLTDEVAYYAPNVEASMLSTNDIPVLKANQHVFVLGSFLDEKNTSAQVGSALSALRRNGTQVDEITRPNVKIWEFTK